MSLPVTIRAVGPRVSLLLLDGTLLLALERPRSLSWLLGGSCSRRSLQLHCFGEWDCVCTGRDELSRDRGLEHPPMLHELEGEARLDTFSLLHKPLPSQWLVYISIRIASVFEGRK
jgi:hypothetical protein